VVTSHTSQVLTIGAGWSPATTPINGASYVIATLTHNTNPFAAGTLGTRTVVSGSNWAVVHSNTNNTLTLATPWTPSTPSAGAAYNITPQAAAGTIGSNTADRISLESGWTPATPPAGTQYYITIPTLANNVLSNTAQTMTMTAPWAPIAPTAGSAYQVANSQPTSACGVGSYSTTITYDPAKLQFISGTNSSFLLSTGRILFISPCNASGGGGTVTIACHTQAQVPLGPTGSGTFANIKFKSLVGAAGTQTTVTHTTDLTDVNGFPIDHTDTAGTVLFSKCGDMDGDGAVSIGDVLQIVARIGQTPAHPQWLPKYDLDDTATITIGDALYALAMVGQLCTGL
jgi:hypothetical protein